MQKNKINIAEIEPCVTTLGPGRRFAIWVQGCPFNCQNCMSKEWIPFTLNKPTKIDRLALKIINADEIDGVTISGGEPFMQAEQLASLIEYVRTVKPELSFVVYSGFKKNRLTWPSAVRLLSNIDLLIDGLYVDDLNDNKSLKGSINQEFHYLSSLGEALRSYYDHNERKIESFPRRDGSLMVGLNKLI